MNSAFDFHIRAFFTALGAFEVLDVDCGYVSVFVEVATDVFDDVRAFKTHDSVGLQAEVLGRRIESKIVLLDVEFSAERGFVHACVFRLRIVFDIHGFALSFGIVIHDEFERFGDDHSALGTVVQVLSHAVFENGNIHFAVRLGYAYARTEISDRLGRVTSLSDTRKSG